jgi:CrcB protein
VIFLVAIGAGGLAAVVRYLVTLAFRGRGALPWAVLIVNSIGSALGGVAVGLWTTETISSDLRLVLIGGLAGGLTTFSTWSVESLQLALSGKWRTAGVNIGLNLVIGVAAAIGGYLVSTALGA